MDVIIVGLQTDYCIDATIKCSFEHGFNMIILAYTNTTVDNEFISLSLLFLLPIIKYSIVIIKK